MAFSATNAIHRGDRIDYLDAVRAFALILGIVFHASISFLPIFIGWAVMDINTSQTVGVFMLSSHSFRMPLFFLIAGFFSHLVFHREGMAKFVKTRFIRLAIPFLLGWFLLRPLLVSGWLMGGDSMRGDVDISHGFSMAWATLQDLPTGLFVGTHLWFLYYLIMISVSVLLMRSLVNYLIPKATSLYQISDKAIAWLAQSRFSVIILSLPTALGLWFMNHWGIDTPDKSLIPDIPVFLIYAGCFLLGWLLHRQPTQLTSFARLNWANGIICILAIGSSTVLSSFEMQYSHEFYTYLKLTFVISYSLMMWSLISLTIALFKRLFSQPNRLVRYMADASYWLYLIHLPIVVWLQIAFAELPIHWIVKLSSIVVITLFVTLITYESFVRSTLIGYVLNGRKKSRAFLKV